MLKKGTELTHVHLWDGQNIVAEVGATGTVTARFIRGKQLIAREQDGALQYYFHNAHGDVVQRYDSLGNLLKNYRYDAFGCELDPVESDSNPFRYCGEYWDAETKTLYLRNRSYSPSSGRFTQEDPARHGSNWYGYCGGNPVLFHDPRGLYREKKKQKEKEAKATGWNNWEYAKGVASGATAPIRAIANNVADTVKTAIGGENISKSKTAAVRAAGPLLAPTVNSVMSSLDAQAAGSKATANKFKNGQYLAATGDIVVNSIESILPFKTLGKNIELGKYIAAGDMKSASYATGELVGEGLYHAATMATSMQGNETQSSQSGTSRVGRWMSVEEYNKMVSTEKVQMSPNGNTCYVACPADPNAFKAAPKGSVYVEFDVDSSALYPAGKDGWMQIAGPGSLRDRLNIYQGYPPITEIPVVSNIIKVIDEYVQ